MNYRPEIDGLRAFAILPVLAFHIDSSLIPGGFAGVDVFFVISGYLITSIIREELISNTFYLRRFYARRVKRLFPAMASVLSFVIFFTFIIDPLSLTEVCKTIYWVLFLGANVYFWKSAVITGHRASRKCLSYTRGPLQ